MDDRGIFNGRGFWPLALLWLPAGLVATAAVRAVRARVAGGGMVPAMLLMTAGSLVFFAPCGLPLALGCRRVWRLGYRRGAGWAWIGARGGDRGGVGGGRAARARSRSLSMRSCSACPCGWPGGGSRTAADDRRRRAGCAAGEWVMDGDAVADRPVRSADRSHPACRPRVPRMRARGQRAGGRSRLCCFMSACAVSKRRRVRARIRLLQAHCCHPVGAVEAGGNFPERQAGARSVERR